MSNLLPDRLRSACLPIWQSLAEHPFLRELAAGTLPEEKFRFYIEQNLMYLPEYSRAIAVGAAMSRDEGQLQGFAASLSNIVAVEIPENEARLAEVIELGAADHGGSLEMSPANLAYTSYLTSAAFRGGPLDVITVLMPCAWSYGEIACGLDLSGNDHPVYCKWVSFFAGDEYSQIVERMKGQMEEYARISPASEDHLVELFKNGARLELGFWEMAYTLERWPDVSPRTS